MSLDLDKRHRAMLREMGVRVWLPNAPVIAEAPVVIEPVVEEAAAPATPAPSTPAVVTPARAPAAVVAAPPPVARPAAAPAAPAAPAAAPRAEPREGVAVSWRLGEAVALYADAAKAQNGAGKRWLVLAETPASALQATPFDPFQGDAGKLLDNMLRAARLHQAGVVLLAPLTRQAAGADAGPDFSGSLAALVQGAQPDLVLVMGRLAAQALLQSTEPFGKLRGQVHTLHGSPLVATYDAPYLLRTQADKAKAWDDLCLALSVVAG